MKTKTVKDLMRPLSEYKTISTEANLFDAALALDQAQQEFEQNPKLHRVLLISDENGAILGKISQLDVLMALEPKYAEIGDPGKISRAGFSPNFLKSMLDRYALWDRPLVDVCKKASEIKVKEFMYTPTEGEYVDENASLGEAIHQLVMGHHQSLLVTRGEEIVGILRLSDVFKDVFQIMKTCEL